MLEIYITMCIINQLCALLTNATLCITNSAQLFTPGCNVLHCVMDGWCWMVFIFMCMREYKPRLAGVHGARNWLRKRFCIGNIHWCKNRLDVVSIVENWSQSYWSHFTIFYYPKSHFSRFYSFYTLIININGIKNGKNAIY